jgi:hypothetical protein
MIVEELAAKLGLDLDEKGFEKGFEAIEGLKLGLGAVAGIAAAVGAALVAVTRGVAENAVELSKAAQRSGVAVDSYQELAFAAEQSGVSSDELQHSLILLSRQAFEAAHGSHEAAFAFRQLGVGIYDAQGKTKPTDELLEDLAERFSKMPDGIKKTALATQAFGRSGAELLPFLNKGRAGIDELREAAYDYGVILDEDVIEAAKRWEEQQKHLTAALKGLRNAIGGEFLKRMGNVVDKIATWIKANRELITERLFTFLDNLQQLLIPIAKIIDEVFIKTDAWKYSLIALAAILAVVNWPLLLIVGALLAIEDAYKFFEGKPSVLGHIFGDPETQEKIRAFMREIRAFIDYLFHGDIAEDVKNVLSGKPAEGLFNALGFKKGGGIQALVESGAVVPTPAGIPLIPPPSVPAAGGTTRSTSQSVQIHQTINAPPGMDPKEIADRSAQRIDEVLQRANREALSAVDQ